MSLTTPARGAAAVADQRAALSADAADQLSQFCRSVQRQPSYRGQFSTPLTNLTLAANLPLPYAQDWDLNIQRSFGSDLLFEIGYVGTKGTKLPRMIEANPAIYIPGFDGRRQSAFISTSSNADQRRNLFRMHTRSARPPAIIFNRPDRGHCQFFLQRSGGQPEEAFQPRDFVSGLLHLLQVDRRRFFLQHDRLGVKARGRGE